jgi:hypothetical protein
MTAALAKIAPPTTFDLTDLRRAKHIGDASELAVSLVKGGENLDAARGAVDDLLLKLGITPALAPIDQIMAPAEQEAIKAHILALEEARNGQRAPVTASEIAAFLNYFRNNPEAAKTLPPAVVVAAAALPEIASAAVQPLVNYTSGNLSHLAGNLTITTATMDELAKSGQNFVFKAPTVEEDDFLQTSFKNTGFTGGYSFADVDKAPEQQNEPEPARPAPHTVLYPANRLD